MKQSAPYMFTATHSARSTVGAWGVRAWLKSAVGVAGIALTAVSVSATASTDALPGAVADARLASVSAADLAAFTAGNIGALSVTHAGSAFVATDALSVHLEEKAAKKEKNKDDKKEKDKDEKPKKKSREERQTEKKMAEVERLYVFSGDTQQCVPLRQLRNSRVIDDQTIFFRFNGRKGFLNRLPNKCIRLAEEERFIYQVSGPSSLCSGQIITVVDSFGRPWGSCSLGAFEVWTKNPALDTSDDDEGGDDNDDDIEGDIEDGGTNR